MRQDALRRQIAALEAQARDAEDRARVASASLQDARTEIARLREGDGRFRELVEHSHDITAVYDAADGTLTYVSAAILPVLGYRPEDTAGKGLGDDVLPEDRETLRTAFEWVAMGESVTVTVRFRHTDASVVHLELAMRPLTDEHGTIRRIAAAGRDVTQRTRAQEALTAANQEVAHQGALMQEAQRIARVGSWVLDRVTGDSHWSPEMHEIFGVDPSEPITALTYQEHMPPGEVPALWEAVAQAGRAGTPFEHEHRVVHPDGSTRVILARGKVDVDATGTITRIQGTGQDVTHQREQERELRRARDLFGELMAATTQQAIIGTDLEGRITVWNSGAALLTGYSAEEMLGSPRTTDVMVPDEAPRLMRVLRSLGLQVPGPAGPATEADLAPHWTYVRKDGGRIQVNLRILPTYDADGEVSGTVGVAIDVTERRRAQRELAEHAQMLRAVIENNQSIISVKDLEGRYLLANHACLAAFRCTEEEVLGTTDDERFPTLAPIWRANDLRAVEGAYTVAEHADLADGRHEYESVKLPLYDADGHVYAICNLSLDVTERRRAEEDSRRAVEAMSDARDRALAANAAKSAFLATMSHEIRTPMNAVIGMSDLLADTALDDRQQDLVQTVRSSGEQLLTIINDVLDFSKVEAGELDLEARPFGLRALVEGALGQRAGSAHALTLSAEIDPAAPTHLVGDQGRLQQVLGNLLGNAVKFTTRGSVLLRASVAPEPEGGPEGGPEGLLIRFDVTDTGIGIPEDAMPRLFRSFSQVDASSTRVYGGTGLGLAISRGLVEAMGGRMWVTSRVGEGSTFSFTIRAPAAQAAQPVPAPQEAATPALPPAPRPAPETGPGSEPAVARPRVLLAEDNKVNQKVATMMLAKLGHTGIDVAENGLLALEAAHAKTYDVVLMDMHMPEMDGLEATRRIRAELPPERQPYIIAVTASVTQEDRDACVAAGMNAYVPKPIRIDELGEAIAGAMVRAST